MQYSLVTKKHDALFSFLNSKASGEKIYTYMQYFHKDLSSGYDSFIFGL
jgi:hypothetical protein